MKLILTPEKYEENVGIVGASVVDYPISTNILSSPENSHFHVSYGATLTNSALGIAMKCYTNGNWSLIRVVLVVVLRLIKLLAICLWTVQFSNSTSDIEELNVRDLIWLGELHL